jgi:hypothetical protein
VKLLISRLVLYSFADRVATFTTEIAALADQRQQGVSYPLTACHANSPVHALLTGWSAKAIRISEAGKPGYNWAFLKLRFIRLTLKR